MSNYAVFAIIIAYLGFLFLVAFFAEKHAKSKWVSNPYVYTLALGVYCTAWTYYGSIGTASTKGIDFLPIYLGPVIALPLWLIVLRKIIRITKQQRISSVADFISLRYGNSRLLGAVVTLVCVMGTLPYIALQLKAVSETFTLMSKKSGYVAQGILDDSTFYIAILLALFAALFGTQKTDATQKHQGIMSTVALESVLKLIFFLAAGIYVTYFLFNGTTDIYTQISAQKDLTASHGVSSLEHGFNWLYLIALSFIAIFLLPRQFQVAVIENTKERHLKKTVWLFPLYLLLFNLFVIFIAWAGELQFGTQENASYFALLLPLQNGHSGLALLVFLGGLSAVISMVVVSTLALSTMISNNLIIPYGYLSVFQVGKSEENEKAIKNIRRVSIFLIIIAAYFFYLQFSISMSLYAIGLIAFVIIAQLAPSFFIGLYWNRGSAKATLIGIILGTLTALYCLVLPIMYHRFTGLNLLVEEGPWGIAALNPYQLFGIDFLEPPAHAFFWSMLINMCCYLSFSLLTKGNYRERNYAEMFVNNQSFAHLQDNALVWKGEAYVDDIRKVLVRFLGETRTERALKLFFKKYKLAETTQTADARLINFSEKLLAGSIGSASAKILIAGVVKEQKVSLVEVLQILEETKEAFSHNKALQDKSKKLSQLTKELQRANRELVSKDHQKDEFLDTVAHEIKTPITGIRAATEVLLDEGEDMPLEIQSQFLQTILRDSERLGRLINNLLDFEKLSHDKRQIHKQKNEISQTLEKAIAGIQHLAAKKQITLKIASHTKVQAQYDEDRLIQVCTNLTSNAIKFSPEHTGIVTISYGVFQQKLRIEIKDNGKGILPDDMPYIFDKFYQSKNQNIVKPEGSGLGLAICKQIIEKHGGSIWAKPNPNKGITFYFEIPL